MIPVRNIYYMLSYAFRSLSKGPFSVCLDEEFENTADLLAEIMIIGFNDQMRRGLLKTYRSYTEKTTTVSGKININRMIKECPTSKEVVSEKDQLTEDSYCNRIVKTALSLLNISEISDKRRIRIKTILVILQNVKTIKPKNIDWNLRINRSNESYVTLISISRFVIEGLIPSESSEGHKINSFLDDQRLSRLFEKFILEYYKQEHPELKTASRMIEWDLSDGDATFLPTMQSDIMLTRDDRTLILDAKYYGINMQEHFERRTIHSGNLYQMFAYVKNQAAKGGTVSGLILYAKTDSDIQPEGDYVIGGNRILVRTLDLNLEFSKIAEQLDEIAHLLRTEINISIH